MEIILILGAIALCALCIISERRTAFKYGKGVRNRSQKNGKNSFFYRVPYTKEQIIGMLSQKSERDRLDYEFEPETLEICMMNKYFAYAEKQYTMSGGKTHGKWYDIQIQEQGEFCILKVTEQKFWTPNSANQVYGLMNAFFVEKLGAVPYEVKKGAVAK